jgi:hypothetical protein
VRFALDSKSLYERVEPVAAQRSRIIRERHELARKQDAPPVRPRSSLSQVQMTRDAKDEASEQGARQRRRRGRERRACTAHADDEAFDALAGVDELCELRSGAMTPPHSLHEARRDQGAVDEQLF